MRVLAFRIWDKTHKKFIDPKDYSINGSRHSGQTGELLLDFDGKIRLAHFPCGNGDNSADSVFEPVKNQDNFVIQQFTGFKDKYGVEIYEGDVLHQTKMRHYTQEEFLEMEKNGTKPEFFISETIVSIPQIYKSMNSVWGVNLEEASVAGNICENKRKHKLSVE